MPGPESTHPPHRVTEQFSDSISEPGCVPSSLPLLPSVEVTHTILKAQPEITTPSRDTDPANEYTLTANNYGPQAQNVNGGRGTQYNNSGEGLQIISYQGTVELLSRTCRE